MPLFQFNGRLMIPTLTLNIVVINFAKTKKQALKNIRNEVMAYLDVVPNSPVAEWIKKTITSDTIYRISLTNQNNAYIINVTREFR